MFDTRLRHHMTSSCTKQSPSPGRIHRPYDISGPLGAEEALNKPDSCILTWEGGWIGKGGVLFGPSMQGTYTAKVIENLLLYK